jgi:hypothetical protein
VAHCLAPPESVARCFGASQVGPVPSSGGVVAAGYPAGLPSTVRNGSLEKGLLAYPSRLTSVDSRRPLISASWTGTRAAGAGFVVRGVRQLQPLQPDRHAGRGPARSATHAGSGVAAGGAAVRDGSSAGDRPSAACPSTSPSVLSPRMLGRRRSWPASPLDRTTQNLQVLSSSGVAVSRETSPCPPRRSWGHPRRASRTLSLALWSLPRGARCWLLHARRRAHGPRQGIRPGGLDSPLSHGSSRAHEKNATTALDASSGRSEHRHRPAVMPDQVRGGLCRASPPRPSQGQRPGEPGTAAFSLID